MNERIQKLLKQSGVGDNWNTADWYSMSPEMIEKFAELIVRECLKCSDQIGAQNKAADGPSWTAAAINSRIKEHFTIDK